MVKQLMALGSLVSLMTKGSQWPRAQEGFHSIESLV